MATVACDKDGNRIMTDILTLGYLRQEIETTHKILIPSEIKQLCFDYWFINICDQWDVESSKKKNEEFIEFDGQIAKRVKKKGHRLCLVYGLQSISSGEFEWRLNLKTVSQKEIAIGVIYDKDSILDEWTHGGFATKGYGMYWYSGGCIMDDSTESPAFGPVFQNQVENFYVSMKINLDELSVYYAFDREEFKKAPCTLSKDEAYRLVIIFGNNDLDEVELM